MKPMKMLLILCSGERIARVRQLIEAQAVQGYTEIPQALGAGLTGRHLGTRAFPGTASLIFTALAAEASAGLIESLRGLAAGCSSGEGVKVFVLDAEEAV